MKKNLLLFLTAAGILLSVETSAQQLKRRAFLGVQLSPVSDSLAKAHKLPVNSGVRVLRIVPGSTAETLKLLPDDVILEVNKTAVKSPQEVVMLARNFQPGQTINLALNRKGKPVKIKGKVQPMPYETAPANAEVRYGEVPLANNGIARSIMKKPKGSGKFPAVFFIQGYGCSSLDNLPENDPQRQLMDALVSRGYAVYRLEKPGVGDSKGSKPCPEIGYNEELAAFASGLDQLKRFDFVDRDNIFLFGHSLGANTAPLIAANNKVKGIITYGAAGKPWTEYLIEVFREQRAITGSDYVEIDEDMKMLLPLVYEFMILKKTPAELTQNGNYKKYLEEHFGYDGKDHLFGRHYTFLQELGQVPVNKAWKDAAAHTLAIYGEADAPAIDEDGAKMIAAVVNAYYPGKGSYEFLPHTDHGFLEVGSKQDHVKQMQSNSPSAAKFNPKLVELIDNWMKIKMAKS
ncbi:alpha/beta fold hydrolase [Adhaeribacter sp. BT258]|uniref:Alpha/beta fold hydrolase n=1 Tax=Adhaeribacter terrigena TaxID=2793070 RepID=A0ABS1C0L2_9BACT|nr:alpha/beta fold hydrolase [Adhaeribacter terrigena]MBK0402697.1 alpha/beta fold hydrolase [Adhaeribacter terrigena]